MTHSKSLLAISVFASVSLLAQEAAIASGSGYGATFSGTNTIVYVDGHPVSRPGGLLHPGDTVSTLTGGMATIVYAGNCTISLAGGSSVVVADSPPCKSSDAQTARADAANHSATITPASAEAPIVRVISENGSSLVVTGQSKPLKLERGMELSIGDKVLVGKKSRVVLYYTDTKCRIELKENSTWKIEKYRNCHDIEALALTAGAGSAAATSVIIPAALGVGGAIAVITAGPGAGSSGNPITPD